MAVDLVQIRKLAERKADENSRFRLFLRTQCSCVRTRSIITTRRVWAGIECCANCCREMKPTFTEEEVDRAAHRRGTERQQFIETYLQPIHVLAANTP